MLHVTVIQDPNEFDALEPEWTHLLSNSCNKSITLTWHWLRTWWSVYHGKRRLRLITVRENGRLIGAAPMLSREAPYIYFGILPFRRMELMASGEVEGDQICSDYLDWIAEAGREQEVIFAILNCMCKDLCHEWEELCLPDISERSPILALLEREALRRNLRFEIIKREPCSIIRLPTRWEDFLNTVSSGLRYKIRRGRRELEQLDGEYNVVSRFHELEEAVDTLIKLHQKRWTEKGKPGAFVSLPRRTFHQRFIPIALRQGWLRLGILKIKGEPVGAIYNFRYGKKIYFYQSGITLSDNKHFRPGIIMHSFEVESAIESNCTEYDFLKRGHSEYKDVWTNDQCNLLYVRIAKKSVKETLFGWTRTMHERIRGIKHRIVN